MPHKGLKSPKRFKNLPLGSMSSILNLMGFMHGVPRTLRNYNALIEVFKFIWGVETFIRSDPYLSQSHQDWGLWTFSSKLAECAPPCPPASAIPVRQTLGSSWKHFFMSETFSDERNHFHRIIIYFHASHGDSFLRRCQF